MLYLFDPFTFLGTATFSQHLECSLQCVLLLIKPSSHILLLLFSTPIFRTINVIYLLLLPITLQSSIDNNYHILTGGSSISAVLIMSFFLLIYKVQIRYFTCYMSYVITFFLFIPACFNCQSLVCLTFTLCLRCRNRLRSILFK